MSVFEFHRSTHHEHINFLLNSLDSKTNAESSFNRKQCLFSSYFRGCLALKANNEFPDTERTFVPIISAFILQFHNIISLFILQKARESLQKKFFKNSPKKIYFSITSSTALIVFGFVSYFLFIDLEYESLMF